MEAQLTKHIEDLQEELKHVKQLINSPEDTRLWHQAATQTPETSVQTIATQTIPSKIPSLKEKVISKLPNPIQFQSKTYKFKKVSVSPDRLELDPNRLRTSNYKFNAKKLLESSTERKAKARTPFGFQPLREDSSNKSLKLLRSNASNEHSLTSFIMHLQDRLTLGTSSISMPKIL